ncbi:caspase family protein [Myxococcota bacterium]|nr:caspase family protein [Myxococcota bacterium]
MKAIYFISVFVFISALHTNAGAKSSKPVVRLAFLVGSNYGGSDRVKLIYSHSDTRAVSKVFQEIGGVSPSSTYMLLEPDIDKIIEYFEILKKTVSSLKSRGNIVQLIFYYSGHSDDTGLLPGGKRLQYKKLRLLLKEVKADVTIGILDSCSSGAITRTKGGKWVPSFLSGPSDQATGEVFLTSSSATEAAQESDKIKGSYFTHYLITGLRGAADVSKDEKITVGEAYQYAFARTLAGTESSKAGPQHPNYAFQLAGAGDLVVTELKRTKSKLFIPASVTGRILVRNARGDIVSEVEKNGKIPIVLALKPGVYTVTFFTGKTVRQGRVVINTVKVTMFDVDNLYNKPLQPSRSKGYHGETYLSPFSISFTPFMSTNRLSSIPAINIFSLNLLYETAHTLHGMEISGIGSIRTGDVRGLQIGGLFNVAEGNVLGFQVSGLLNFSYGSFGGSATAGLGNISLGTSQNGFLVSGLSNFALGSTRGVFISGLLNFSGGEVRGIQIASLANIGNRSTKGLQIAGLLNLTSSDFNGLQISGGASIAGDLHGLQISGISNIAKNIKGFQLSGVYNQAENVSGFQLGVINKAKKVRGFQLGVVNIAEESDWSLGLVNIVKNGRYLLGVTGNTFKAGTVEFKHGGKYWHTLYSVSSNKSGDRDRDKILAGAGFGFHIPVSDIHSFDIDAFVRQKAVSDELYTFSTLRFSLFYDINSNLQFMVGAGLSVLAYKGDMQAPESVFKGWVLNDAETNPDKTEVRLIPEVTAGIFYRF